MSLYKYKLVGKPLHPNKQETIFPMLDEFMRPTGNVNLTNSEDWQVLGEKCGELLVKNKHTLEIFSFIILYHG
jgi:hypothetical protein